jgi:hypothetical protein
MAGPGRPATDVREDLGNAKALIDLAARVLDQMSPF